MTRGLSQNPKMAIPRCVPAEPGLKFAFPSRSLGTRKKEIYRLGKPVSQKGAILSEVKNLVFLKN
jgi:hypothetical protein